MDELLLQELRLSIQAFAEHLPDRRRRIWDLSFAQGLSAREVSATLHIAPKTVANERSIIKKELRDRLRARRAEA